MVEMHKFVNCWVIKEENKAVPEIRLWQQKIHSVKLKRKKCKKLWLITKGARGTAKDS